MYNIYISQSWNRDLLTLRRKFQMFCFLLAACLGIWKRTFSCQTKTCFLQIKLNGNILTTKEKRLQRVYLFPLLGRKVRISFFLYVNTHTIGEGFKIYRYCNKTYAVYEYTISYIVGGAVEPRLLEFGEIKLSVICRLF